MMFDNVREIKIGGVNKEELLIALGNHFISMNKYAEQLFADSKFSTSSDSRIVKIVEVSLKQISLIEGGTTCQIFSKAQEYGLSLCPLELAPHFRLQYLDQKQGPYLTVASKKIRNDENYPNGFYLRRLEDGLWLRGYRATSDYIWSADSCFIFLVDGM